MSEAPKGTDVDVSLDIVSLTGLSVVASFPEPSTPRFILQLWRKYFSTYKSGQERDYIHRSVLAHMDISLHQVWSRSENGGYRSSISEDTSLHR